MLVNYRHSAIPIVKYFHVSLKLEAAKQQHYFVSGWNTAERFGCNLRGGKGSNRQQDQNQQSQRNFTQNFS